MSVARKPLLLFNGTDVLPTIPQPTNPVSFQTLDNHTPNRKRWYHYLPLCGTVILILAPQPSWLAVLIHFHLQTLHNLTVFIVHLSISYTLLFMMFSSLLVCLARDPGNPSTILNIDGTGEAGQELELTEALLSEDDFSSPNKWCRKCWAPKPDRTHHCSICGRCVLKMDHHCPWIGAKCIGHRTYPAFVHFLCCSTVLATYTATISAHALWYTFDNPFFSPIHEMLAMIYGMIIAIVIGTFASYHLYLISTNQTTIESLTPFFLLRYLPPLPGTDHSLPTEVELSRSQRRLVRAAHEQILLYDLDIMSNWASIFGFRSITEFCYRLWWGGASPGDGMTFPRNPQSERMLAVLAKALVEDGLDTTMSIRTPL